MQRSGGVAILMGKGLPDLQELNIKYLVGDAEILSNMDYIKPLMPFDERTVGFLNTLSKRLLSDKAAKAYPDVATFAFWIRKTSMDSLKRRFMRESNGSCHIGRGMAFHIAPSNVPVNYAYSLAAGLICGNANIVRIPSKDFPQTTIINKAINDTLADHPTIMPYIVLVRYGRDKNVNDILSAMADIRVIWGGDTTIENLRKSPLKPRATEITFADRYSLAVVDADAYLAMDAIQVARDFYNDTYLTDQNACTSPRVIAWLGTGIDEAKKCFWNALYQLVKERYEIHGIQAVNKLTSSCLLAVQTENAKKIATADNRLVRMQVDRISSTLMELKDNSGYFIETDLKVITDLFDICDDVHCQTVSYIGDQKMFCPLLEMHPRGIDRIVPVGRTMDFDFLWDGYDLFDRMTRIIVAI